MNRLTRDDVKLGFVDSSTLPSYPALYERLREYEKDEEQGVLIRIPCKAGTKVLQIVEECNALSCPKTKGGNCGKCSYYNPHITPTILSLSEIVLHLEDFGETIFFMDEEDKANAKLMELKENK